MSKKMSKQITKEALLLKLDSLIEDFKKDDESLGFILLSLDKNDDMKYVRFNTTEKDELFLLEKGKSILYAQSYKRHEAII